MEEAVGSTPTGPTNSIPILVRAIELVLCSFPLDVDRRRTFGPPKYKEYGQFNSAGWCQFKRGDVMSDLQEALQKHSNRSDEFLASFLDTSTIAIRRWKSGRNRPTRSVYVPVMERLRLLDELAGIV